MANHISSPSVEEPHNDIPFSLEGAVDELAAEISEMQDENEATGVDVANLFKTQEKLLWEVSDLDQRVGVLKSYGETVRRRMDGITQRVDQLHFFYEQSKGQSSAQTEQGTKLEERMDNLQKKLQSVLERLDGGTNPEFLLSKGEAQFKGKHPVGRGSEHKEESSRFETQLKIESSNSIARTQNSFLKSKTGPIMPLKSLETGKAIAEFPNTLLQLDKLERSSLRKVLKHLGAEISEEGSGNANFDSTLAPDPFGHLWRRISSSQRRSSFESSNDLISMEQYDEEAESLRRQLRLYIGAPVYGLGG
ncbi:hypothetical protein MMC10_001979 [Thelotrema lepadinum]|nr:hypothetical protein [Thelotrema lepadinum]